MRIRGMADIGYHIRHSPGSQWALCSTSRGLTSAPTPITWESFNPYRTMVPFGVRVLKYANERRATSSHGICGMWLIVAWRGTSSAKCVVSILSARHPKNGLRCFRKASVFLPLKLAYLRCPHRLRGEVRGKTGIPTDGTGQIGLSLFGF
jgi:hypothetical protein